MPCRRLRVLLTPLAITVPMLAACGATGEGQILEADERATVLHITDEWSGLSPASPQWASFELELNDQGGYQGTASYSVGMGGQQQLRDSAAILIPPGPVDSFYAVLARIEAEPGDYEPRIAHTDDYPRLVIELISDSDTVRLYTSSQGRGHAPWGLRRDETEYVVDSTLPFEALERLRPHLRMEKLEGLIERRLSG